MIMQLYSKTSVSQLTGTIRDGKTGDIVKTASAAIFDRMGNPITLTMALPDGGFVIDMDLITDPATTYMVIAAPGYKKKKVVVSTLWDQPDIALIKSDDIPLWMIAAVITAVMIYRKKKKKIGAFSMGDVLPIFLILGGIIAFDLIKRILIKLGIWDSKDTKELDDIASDPDSFWSPLFWQNRPQGQPFTYAFTEAQAKQICQNIRDNFGWIDDCEECVVAEFKKCRTKANLSFLVWVYQKYWNSDLLTFVRGGNWPYDGLSDFYVNQINNYIKGLPSY